MSNAYLSLMLAALNTPLGVVVETSDAETLRQRLYAERKKAPDRTLLDTLSFLLSPDDTKREVWILRTAEIKDAPES